MSEAQEFSNGGITASAPLAAPGAIGRHYEPSMTAGTSEAAPSPSAPGEQLAVNTPAQASEQPAQELDAAALSSGFFDDRVTVGRYVFEAPPRGVESSQEQEMAIRTLFAAEKIPVSVGQHISKLWNQACANPPTAEAKALAAQKVMAELNRGGEVRATETIRLAQQEVARLAKTNPSIVEMLEVSGLGNDRWLIEHLANTARVRGARK